MRFQGGWLPDPYSAADKSFNQVTQALLDRATSSTYDEYLITESTPISDQGQAGTCVANATADSLEILLGLEGKVIQLSRLAVYWMARHLDGNTKVDQGTHVRSAFTQIRKLGVCPEAYWPYSDDKSSPTSPIFLEPSLQALESGNANKITNFYRIGSTDTQRLDDIELAVRANHPVVFGTVVGQAFEDYQTGTLSQPSDALGGHALIIAGVRKSKTTGKRDYWIRNSWSASWGISGHCWFSEGYIKWSQSNDFWVPTRMDPIVV